MLKGVWLENMFLTNCSTDRATTKEICHDSFRQSQEKSNLARFFDEKKNKANEWLFSLFHETSQSRNLLSIIPILFPHAVTSISFLYDDHSLLNLFFSSSSFSSFVQILKKVSFTFFILNLFREHSINRIFLLLMMFVSIVDLHRLTKYGDIFIFKQKLVRSRKIILSLVLVSSNYYFQM